MMDIFSSLGVLLYLPLSFPLFVFFSIFVYVFLFSQATDQKGTMSNRAPGGLRISRGHRGPPEALGVTGGLKGLMGPHGASGSIQELQGVCEGLREP